MNISTTKNFFKTVDEHLSLESTAWHSTGASVGYVRQIIRVFDIVRNYRWSQLARRSLELVWGRFNRNKAINQASVESNVALKIDAPHIDLALVATSERGKHATHTLCDLHSGRLVLLNKAATVWCGNRFDTGLIDAQTHLWRFQFHYHEFLLTAVAKGEGIQVERYLQCWIHQYQGSQVRFRDDAWHPYCISRRVVSWIFLLLHPDAIQEDSLKALMLKSITQQCEHLSRNLEYGLGGNHLLENATALAIAGSTIECDSRNKWIILARRILLKELPRQILEGGEHYERSPIYHCHVVSNLLRVIIVSSDDAAVSASVRPYIHSMLTFLESILHPDGEVPLFGDSVFQESPSVAEIYKLAALCSYKIGAPDRSLIKSEDYTALSGQKIFVLFDHGAIAADHLPAHGHCDALNLEVSIEGKRWIVDSGNFDYEDSSMRHYCRSSIAHNVVTVENKNQANIWSKFRMGSRPKISAVKRGGYEHWEWVSSSHNAYRKLAVSVMTRMLARHNDALFCCDCWQADPKTSAQMIGYIHFHPNVRIEQLDSSNGRFHFGLSFGNARRNLTVFAEAVSIEQGWYCPEFGKRIQNQVICYSGVVTTGFLAWVLHDSMDVEIRVVGVGKFNLYCNKNLLKWESINDSHRQVTNSG